MRGIVERFEAVDVEHAVDGDPAEALEELPRLGDADRHAAGVEVAVSELRTDPWDFAITQ